MPTAQTRFLGALEYTPAEVIHFPAGIPPFPDTRFLALSEESRHPLVFLQSLDNEELCFITVPAQVAAPGYQLSVRSEDLEHLRWREDRPPRTGELTCLAILTIPEAGDITANLLAPVLIHPAESVGVQALRLDGAYTHSERLPATEASGGPRDAGD